ncbi:50S ribosomal protein L9, partial [Candidatus Peregrinibacteria bacterium CG11_big_fil_rev_8_21_14_0_20_46_8]
YFRNFLLPRKLAVRATAQELARWEKLREQIMIEKQQLREKAAEIRERLSELTLKITKKTTKTGKLYGGVHAKDIVDALKAEAKIEVPEEAVLLKEPIKEAGEHEVGLQLAEDVSATVKVAVSGE